MMPKARDDERKDYAYQEREMFAMTARRLSAPFPRLGGDQGDYAAGANTRLKAELFRTATRQAYVDIYNNGHRETLALRSLEYSQWLRSRCREVGSRIPSRAELARHIDILEAEALQPDTPENEVHLRVGSANGSIFIDIGDENRTIVKVTANGWALTQNSPVRFLRPPSMSPLPIPQRGGTVEMLRPLLNLPDQTDFVLVVAWLLNLLRGNGGHPVLVVDGGEGTAKSVASAILTALVDPNSTPPKGLPRSKRELHSDSADRYLNLYDNVSRIPVSISNALCRSSGSHPTIINGIGDLVMRPDLADRCINIILNPISETHRRPETEIWKEFEDNRAGIFGALLDGLSHGLAQLAKDRPCHLPRMADFAVWSAAFETAYWPKGTFEGAYRDNRLGVVERFIESNEVASAVRSFIGSRTAWSGTATQLLLTLGPIFSRMGKVSLPTSPRNLSGRLHNAAATLGKRGIRIEFLRLGHGHERIISISTAEDDLVSGFPPSAPSAPSASSASPPPQSKPDLASSAPLNSTDPRNDVRAVANKSQAAQNIRGHRIRPILGVPSLINVGGRMIPVVRFPGKPRAPIKSRERP
jgi:hypothetical protein